MSTHNIYFHGEIKKYLSDCTLIWSYYSRQDAMCADKFEEIRQNAVFNPFLAE